MFPPVGFTNSTILTILPFYRCYVFYHLPYLPTLRPGRLYQLCHFTEFTIFAQLQFSPPHNGVTHFTSLIVLTRLLVLPIIHSYHVSEISGGCSRLCGYRFPKPAHRAGPYGRRANRRAYDAFSTLFQELRAT